MKQSNPNRLRIALGQCSSAGRKECNQDFYGARLPQEPQLSSKGIALAIADGISSSRVSQEASQTAVVSFLEDYYCTSEAWSVRQSAQRVLLATNSWLCGQTQQSQYRYDKDRGYVCTFSALILKSNTAHLFHVGDGRIYRVRDGSLELLTQDHRISIAPEVSYLGRALGVNQHVDIDYRSELLEPGDLFLLVTDGVYEHLTGRAICTVIDDHREDLDAAAQALVATALANGSNDNLTVQLLRIEQLPLASAPEALQQLDRLPLPPLLDARIELDGFTIIRQLHASHRSHVWLASDQVSGNAVVIKVPATEQRQDPLALERFVMEEWIARRINSPHVLKPWPLTRKRSALYTVMEFVEGQTLTQWLRDNPKPDLAQVRTIISQIGKGLRAFHRQGMVHQDLRPDNIMIDRSGTLKIIDFGATRVAGAVEMDPSGDPEPILGTEQYSAPEYFLGASGTPAADLFSLGVICYQMLCGRLPYGTAVPRARTLKAQRALSYQPLLSDELRLPAWVDAAIRRAVHPDPAKRYQELSEFLHDLHQPAADFVRRSKPPLIERDPLLFWKGLSLLLALLLVVVVATHPALS